MVVDDDSSSDDSCDGERLSLAEDRKHVLARGNALWHSMRLYCPPFTCGQCSICVSVAMGPFSVRLEWSA